jgi:hypothetical protein
MIKVSPAPKTEPRKPIMRRITPVTFPPGIFFTFFLAIVMLCRSANVKADDLRELSLSERQRNYVNKMPVEPDKSNKTSKKNSTYINNLMDKSDLGVDAVLAYGNICEKDNATITISDDNNNKKKHFQQLDAQ